jgi:hypothetical protein
MITKTYFFVAFRSEKENRKERNGKTAIFRIIEYVSGAGDVAEIVTDDDFACVGAEHAFTEHKYPVYKMSRRSLIKAMINGMPVRCDELTINNGSSDPRVSAIPL